jgi:hypothetical protein
VHLTRTLRNIYLLLVRFAQSKSDRARTAPTGRARHGSHPKGPVGSGAVSFAPPSVGWMEVGVHPDSRGIGGVNPALRDQRHDLGRIIISTTGYHGDVAALPPVRHLQEACQRQCRRTFDDLVFLVGVGAQARLDLIL